MGEPGLENDISPPPVLQLLPLHTCSSQVRSQCCALLNWQWPRSETARMRMLESSKEQLPTCLALLQSFPDKGNNSDDKSSNVVLGHARLVAVLQRPRAVLIESVVIHPDLRGKGYGRVLMLLTEEYCRYRGYQRTYLCTEDQQIFYSKIGYAFCAPVASYTGNQSLPGRLGKLCQGLSIPPTEVRKPGPNCKKTARDGSEGASLPKLPPKMPTDAATAAAPAAELTSHMDDISLECSQVYRAPNDVRLPDILPRLEQPPKTLAELTRSSFKWDKPTARLNKKLDYMTKPLKQVESHGCFQERLSPELYFPS